MLKVVISKGRILWLLWAAVIAMLVCDTGWTSEDERSVPWHLEDAKFRIRIEKDPAYAQVPEVHLSDSRKSENERQWNGSYHRLNGKVYKKGITISCPGEVSYKHQKEYRRFVALAGLTDRADPNMSVRLEVYADKRRIFKSEPITKYMLPVEINVGLPSTAKNIKLAATGTDENGEGRLRLVDAGFLLRGENPEVSYAKLYMPGYDARDYEPVMFTSIGQQVPCRIFQAKQDGLMEILFDNSRGSTIYFVYLVQKDRYKPAFGKWEPKAGVTLETRYTTKNYSECKKLPGLMKVWNNNAKFVDKTLVDNIHHSYPLHHISDLKGAKPRLALYRYEGIFKIDKAGEYTFATASNWASHLLVDGNLVISWPGEHNYRSGIRGQKQGKVSLQAGVHKLEYLNYSPWGNMFTLAAWQKPNEKLGIMARDDFLPFERFVATAVGYKDLAKDGGSFKWQVIDDWRLDQGKEALVRMRFDVMEARLDGYYSYRWKFDDGKVQTGKSVEHVFLRPQMRTVILEILKGNEVVAEVRQKIDVHVISEKIQLEPGDEQAFEQAVSDSDFNMLPMGDVVNLYAFADGLERQQWKQRAVVALIKRADELVSDSDHWNFCLDLGRYLRSAPIRQYEQALTLFGHLSDKSAGNTIVYQDAVVSQAELLVQCFGKYKEALEILEKLEKRKKLDNKIITRFRTVQAEAMIALEQVEQARDILQNLHGDKSNKQEVKNVGLLRHARQLVDNTGDAEQLDYAMENIEKIIADDPIKLLAPNLNLIKLDVHLARKEYLIAFYLAERLNMLELSNYYRSQLLVRQVKALCGIEAVERAKMIYETMMLNYPYSPAVAEAKRAIVETVVSGQKR
jgi:outer membrane protein assembly factor BamD (BamD/ComL family)